jgi:V8-like Glu-specific endopeptidase
MLHKNQTNQTTILRSVRHQFFNSLVACALLAAGAIGAIAQTGRTDSQQRGTNEVRHPLAEPLAKEDARAQLSAELRNALPLPAAEHVTPFAQTEGVQTPTMVEVNLRTGRETRSTGYAAAEALQDELRLAPVTGYKGPASQTYQSDRNAEKSQIRSVAQTESCGDSSQANRSVWSYPMSAQVKLFMTFPNGVTYEGSGTIIGSKYVLTSMNNVYHASLGGLATRIEVIPGLDGYYKPFGSAYASYIRYYYDGYSKVGLLTLDRHIGNSTGWLGYGSFSDSYLSSRWGHQFGYRADRDYGRVLYYDNGKIENLNRDWLSVGITFNSGEMGAGMYLLDAYGSRYVFGVAQNTWYCGTWGSRLTDWITGQLRYVISYGL